MRSGPFPGRHEGPHLGQKSADGTGAMAQHGFDGFAQFAERAVVFDHFEQRVVAKAGGSDPLEANPPHATAAAFETNVPRGIGER